MYRFAAGPTQSRRWIFHADCLTRVATNGPYTTSTTPEPLEDQCWRVQTSGQRFGKSTREQIGALPPPYGRQLGSIIVREFQRLLRCSPAKRVFPSSCPHSLSTEAHRPSADLPSAVPAPCLADKLDTLTLADESCAHHDYHLLVRGSDCLFGWLSLFAISSEH